MGLSSQGTILIHGFPILTETWTLSQSHRSSPEYELLMPVVVVAVAVVVVVVVVQIISSSKELNQDMLA